MFRSAPPFTRAATPKHGTHAIVIGGSMAGLLAARVLTHHFERVTIIDRDRFPAEPTFRKGVPQSRHFHLLLARGLQILEAMFPNLGVELTAQGAQTLDTGADGLWLTAAGWGPRVRSGVTTLCLSRSLLEWNVRRRVAALPQVRFIEECDVTGLLTDERKQRIVGVQLHSRNPTDQASDTDDIHADLVVDASGRSSRTPQWLESLGYQAPAETNVNSFVRYATRYYDIPTDFHADWKSLFLFTKPPACARGGALFPIEGNRWVVTLSGSARDYPPTDEAGFLDFVRSLRSPLIYETIKTAQPASSIHAYQRMEGQLRHYERLQRMPDRFVVIGDAVCAFNPIYGQGMTTAARGALVLDHWLGKQPAATRRFQQRLARSNADPWLIATGEDFRYPTTEGGQRSLATRFLHWYLDRVIPVAAEDPHVMTTYTEVIMLLKSPSALFSPKLLTRALLHRPTSTTNDEASMVSA